MKLLSLVGLSAFIVTITQAATHSSVKIIDPTPGTTWEAGSLYTIRWSSMNESGVNPDDEPGVNPDKEPGVNPDNKPGVNPDDEPGVNPDNKPGVNPDNEPGVNPDNKPGVNPDNKPGVNPDNKPGVNPDSETGVNPDNDRDKTRAETIATVSIDLNQDETTVAPLAQNISLSQGATQIRIPDHLGQNLTVSLMGDQISSTVSGIEIHGVSSHESE